MNTSVHREKFAFVASLPDADIDLIDAALLIAAENDNIGNTDRYRNLIRKLAARYEERHEPGHQPNRGPDQAPNCELNMAPKSLASSLTDFIHQQEGFGGNIKNYHAPENSYLNRVLETRQGIPITLALIHIGIGRELDLQVGGINFPGHFLVRYGHDKPLIVDPFSGRVLSETDCVNLLKQISGGKLKLTDYHFEFAPNKVILMRILDNLKQIFWRNQSWHEAGSCIERQLLITPESDELILQLGAINEMLGQIINAQGNYSTVLERSKNRQIIETAGKRLLALTPKPTISH